jgi:4-amino-4-deoxy-L-arabinose transferase-like glycosyltransferase
MNTCCFVPGPGPTGTSEDVQQLVEYVLVCQEIAQALAEAGKVDRAVASSQMKTGGSTLAIWFQRLRNKLSTDWGVLLLLTLGWGLFLTLLLLFASRQYGFHRDELALLDNGQHLAWGYVEYPPLAPFLAHIDLALFGLSLIGIRSFSILVVCLVLLLTALMARELGGSGQAQIVAGLAAVTAPVLFFDGLFLSYETFDYLWWVAIAYCMIRLLKSQDPRWWLAIGAAIGLGAMTKYTMAFEVMGIIAGVLLTPARRFLKSPWLWAGAALAALIVLPNLVWQAQHQFISLHFTFSIHARDIRIGRTGLLSFLLFQLFACTNLAALALWVTGFWFYARRPEGQAYRALAWMAVVPFGLFLVLQGRFYYPAPIYPMLIAAGSYHMERKRQASLGRSPAQPRGWRQFTGLAVSSLLIIAIAMPLAPVNSALGQLEISVISEYREEIGWRELTRTVAEIYQDLPAAERTQAGILAGNYGEAGAIDLYGAAYGLPKAISGIDSYWLRGYGDPPPQTLIVLGLNQQEVSQIFQSCQLAGHTSNRYGILNEETRDHPDVFVCRYLRQSWPQFWKTFQYFG